jgi:uncharacterized protein (TIGR03435 family)
MQATALQEQLGLRLVSKKVPFEITVIESAQRPRENDRVPGSAQEELGRSGPSAGLIPNTPSQLQPLSFEVTSIKPTDPTTPQRGNALPCSGLPRLNPKRFQAVGVTTYTLIAWALGTDSCVFLAQHGLITVGPSWVRSERFDIDAVMPDGIPAYTNMQLMGAAAPKLQLMLQAMLADRFKLVAHRDTKEMAVYALMVAKASKLQESKEGSCSAPGSSPLSGSASRHICGGSVILDNGATLTYESFGIGLNGFAQRLGPRLDRPVVNRSDVPGLFDFSITFTPDDATPGFPRSQSADPGGPSLFTAIQEQLGLKLEPTRAPVTTLVIDQVERPKPN